MSIEELQVTIEKQEQRIKVLTVKLERCEAHNEILYRALSLAHNRISELQQQLESLQPQAQQ